jgi:hypothetical protein
VDRSITVGDSSSKAKVARSSTFERMPAAGEPIGSVADMPRGASTDSLTYAGQPIPADDCRWSAATSMPVFE